MDKMGLTPKQRKMFLSNVFRQASTVIKAAFKHFIDTMKKNKPQ